MRPHAFFSGRSEAESASKAGDFIAPGGVSRPVPVGHFLCGVVMAEKDFLIVRYCDGDQIARVKMGRDSFVEWRSKNIEKNLMSIGLNEERTAYCLSLDRAWIRRRRKE